MANPTISIDSTHIRSPSLTSTSTSTPRFATPPPRHSLDARLTPSSNPASPPPQSTTTTTTTTRKNRTALRQFYGLPPSPSPSPSTSTTSDPPPPSSLPPLDRPDFSPEAYLTALLRRADLRELLRAENELVAEIRGFDGERGALVYDNYSKLIVATETIVKMRSSMEPLTPTTSTLEPAIAHIAQLSGALSETIQRQVVPRSGQGNGDGSEDAAVRRRKRETVKWALGAPGRIEEMLREGRREEAETEWAVVGGLLEKWGDGVRGVRELREEGEKALRGGGEAVDGVGSSAE